MKIIKFTNYSTGEPYYVNFDNIVSFTLVVLNDGKKVTAIETSTGLTILIKEDINYILNFRSGN